MNCVVLASAVSKPSHSINYSWRELVIKRKYATLVNFQALATSQLFSYHQHPKVYVGTWFGWPDKVQILYLSIIWLFLSIIRTCKHSKKSIVFVLSSSISLRISSTCCFVNIVLLLSRIFSSSSASIVCTDVFTQESLVRNHVRKISLIIQRHCAKFQRMKTSLRLY